MGEPSRTRVLMDWLLIAAFLLALALPGLVHLVTPDDPWPIWRENRRPPEAPAPAFDLAALRRFPAEFEAYYDDFFRGRTALVRLHNALWLFGLRTAPNDQFVVGEDGFLFTTVNEVLEQHRGLRPLTVAEEREAERVLRRRVAWARECGSRYVVVVGPNKHSIHPERLPAWARGSHGVTPMDQLVRIAERVDGALVLDLRPALRRAARDEDVYYPYGTHWNRLGAHLAYREVFAALARDGLAVHPLDRSQFEIAPARLVADSWGPSLHLTDALLQDGFAVEPREPVAFDAYDVDYPRLEATYRRTEGPTREALRVLWVADSFGQDLLPYVQLHARSLLEGPKYSYDPELIGLARPDVVLHVIVERHLPFAGLREHRWERAFFGTGGEATERALATFAGAWVNPVHGSVVLEREGERVLLVQRGMRVPLERLGPTLWRLEWGGPRTCVWLERAEESAPRLLRVLDGESLRGATFVHAPPAAADPRHERLVGTYRDAAGSAWHVASAERALALFGATGHLLGQLEPTGPDRFELQGTPTTGQVSFTERTTGVVVRIVLDGRGFEAVRD